MGETREATLGVHVMRPLQSVVRKKGCFLTASAPNALSLPPPSLCVCVCVCVCVYCYIYTYTHRVISYYNIYHMVFIIYSTLYTIFYQTLYDISYYIILLPVFWIEDEKAIQHACAVPLHVQRHIKLACVRLGLGWV